ncbi:hypothetical protein REC12_23150 [Desulfosporosinus sp. PR]|uniref:hypothetical protein n=1 Tax=Candidatus Desulfosporosinus nitrosoreducens TaxID=3401928 RepID=UPI0027FE17AD|nr:hypothetical protein [Desulfosporosinus sp. PR]MDQ7096497.1 hypothetical protein [Desulfosporosinus sp. PR]
MRMPFSPPTDYYCRELAQVDEQICTLLAKRKEISNNNPGFPGLDLISAWSQTFGLEEDWLRRIFAVYMLGEERFQPPVEPVGFLKFVPVLKAVTIENMTYSVTHLKQYSNASVVYVEAELNAPDPFVQLRHANFELFISPEYQCRSSHGSGHAKGIQHAFVVTPTLPDDVSGLEFRLDVKPFERPKLQEISLLKTSVTIK